MASPPPAMDSDSVVHQCLAFSRDLVEKGRSFKFSFTSNNVKFSFSTMEERKPSTMEKDLKKKKLSPSTRRRNARRREEFLKEKSNDYTRKEACKHSDIDYKLKEALDNPMTLKCYRCRKNLKSKEFLGKHVSEENLKSVICKQCGFESQNDPIMKEHKQSAHVTNGYIQSKSKSILSSTPVDHDDIDKLLKECGKDLLDDDEENEVNDSSCYLCKKDFKTITKLINHFKANHMDELKRFQDYSDSESKE